jgi:hypothetical protein
MPQAVYRDSCKPASAPQPASGEDTENAGMIPFADIGHPSSRSTPRAATARTHHKKTQLPSCRGRIAFAILSSAGVALRDGWVVPVQVKTSHHPSTETAFAVQA